MRDHEIDRLLEATEALRKQQGLTRRDLAQRLAIPHNSFRTWFGGSSRRPASRYLGRLIRYVEQPLTPVDEESLRRTEQLRRLLLEVERELRWFRDGSRQTRDVLRDELDAYDMGYLASLLAMLGDEVRFRRWLALSTNQFNSFRGGVDSEESSDST